MWELNEEIPEPLSENGGTDAIWWTDAAPSGDLVDIFLESMDTLDPQKSGKAVEWADGHELEQFGLEENSYSFKSRFAKTQSQILSSSTTLSSPSNVGLGIEIDLTEKMPNARRPIPSWPSRYQSGRAQTVSPCEDARECRGQQDEIEPHSELVCNSSAELGEESRELHIGEENLVQKPMAAPSVSNPPLLPLPVPHQPVVMAPPPPPEITAPLTSESETAPVSPHKDRSPRLIQRKKSVGPSYNTTTSKNHLTLPKRSFTTSSLSSRYRVGNSDDHRQVSRRTPLWKRRVVSHKGSLPQTKTDMLAAHTHSYDLSTVSELMGYPTIQEQSDSLLGKDISRSDHLPLSPPLSSARSSFLLPSNTTTSHSTSNLYSLSSESLPVFKDGTSPNTLSRPHSMPHLQDQPNLGYDQPRHYLQHQQSHEYLSHSESFEDDSDKSNPYSAYSSFGNRYTISETMDIDVSDAGSSPQTWWDQNVNLELAQDEAMAYASQTPSAAYHALQTQTLPTKCQSRFQRASGHETLASPLLYLQQPRSPIAEHDRLYADLMNRTHSSHSSIPSPPGSPAYYFSPDFAGEGFAASPQAVQFVDPFQHQQQQQQQQETQQQHQVETPSQRQQNRHHRGNATSHHCDPRQQASTTAATTTTRSRGMTTSSLVSSMSSSSVLPPSPRPYSRKGNTSVPTSRRPSVHSLSKGSSAAARAAAAAAAAAAADPKEVSFVNFTPQDATKILSGVAPSGSSKTKARREREAEERRRKLSEAAAAAVLAAGGDPSNIPLDF